MAGSIFIPLVSVFDAKGIRQAQSSMQGLTGVLKNLKSTAALAAASFATVGAGNFIKESVTAARDLERSIYGLDAIFGSASSTMEQFSKNAKDIGLNQIDAANASTFLGSVLKQSGMPMQEVIGRTQDLVGLAADLSAVYKYDVSEALTGMTAIFRGEYDPIEKFGVAMKQNEVNALLAERGQNKLTGSALKYATAVAKIDLLLSRSVDAQGAYAAQQETMYVAQKNLSASFTNLQTAVGAKLQEPLANLLQSMTPLVELAGVRLIPIFDILAKVMDTLTPLVEPLSEVFAVLLDALTPILDVLVALIQPLMIPLVSVIKLLTTVLKPFIPAIELVANIFSAVFVPVLTVVALALDTIVKLVDDLLKKLTEMPFFSWFLGLSAGLKESSSGYSKLSDELLNTDKSANTLADTMSKKLTFNPLDVVKKQAEDAKASLDKAADSMNSLIDDAKNVQKSLISAFDITSILDKNEGSVVESVVYVNRQFKVVTSSMSKGAQNLASAFQNNLNKLKKFYQNIKALDKTNLDPELLMQIVSAGPEAGNATAEAILASGEKGVSALNKTFGDIRRISGNIGAKIAKQMKSVGSRMGNGLIDGMVSERDRLVAQAAAIGKEMGAALGTSLSDESNRLGIQNLAKTMETLKPSFTGSYIAGLGSGVNVSSLSKSKRPKLMTAFELTNPYKEGTSRYQGFEKARTEANNYNISVNVAPGASGIEVGRALVKAIREYERVNGKVLN